MTRFRPGDPTSELLQEMIDRADEGDSEAGLELIESIITELHQSNSDLLHWHAQKLQEIVEGVPAPRALCIESDKKKGRPPKWDSIQVIAIDQLLRRFTGLSEREAGEIIEQRLGVDQRTLAGYRKELETVPAENGVVGLAGYSREQLVVVAGANLKEVSDRLDSED